MNHANGELYDPPAQVYRHQAMATWFEIHVFDEDVDFARCAATEAFRLLDQLEHLLSRYREESEISIISRLQPGEVFTAHGEVLRCLSLAWQMSTRTLGAFDPGLGREVDRRKGIKRAEQIQRGRLMLDPDSCRIACEGGCVSLDLGAIGKGYALDRMEALLLEWGVNQALLVGGGSSIRTLNSSSATAPYWSSGLPDGSKIWLKEAALGCSGIAVQGAHIINPLTGLPAEGPERIWVIAKTAAEADAFSTAFMVLPKQDVLAVVEKEQIAVAYQAKGKSSVNWLLKPSLATHGAYIEIVSIN